MDKMTKEQRHKCMAAIHSKNTRPEKIVRKYLFSRGFRYRLNDSRLPGHPDMVMKKYRTVIFVNGCFWHGHEGCKYFSIPKSNTEFWVNKIKRNKIRDEKTNNKLSEMGWHSIIIWECQLKPAVRVKTLNSLEMTLNHLFILNHQKSYDLQNDFIRIAAEMDIPYKQ